MEITKKTTSPRFNDESRQQTNTQSTNNLSKDGVSYLDKVQREVRERRLSICLSYAVDLYKNRKNQTSITDEDIKRMKEIAKNFAKFVSEESQVIDLEKKE